MSTPVKSGQMPLRIRAGTELQRDINGNAEFSSTTPEEWMSRAVATFAEMLPTLRKGAKVVFAKGDVAAAFETQTIENFRKTSCLKAVEGITSFTDLGGEPLDGAVTWDVCHADVIMELTGAASRTEAALFGKTIPTGKQGSTSLTEPIDLLR